MAMRDQGQGGIRQRGRNSWRLKFDLPRAASGKRATRYVTFAGTKREAQAELTRLLNRKAEGTYVDPTKMSVAEYLEHWLTVDIERRVARKNAVRHRQIVSRQIVPRIGAVPVRSLSATHIETLEAELQRSGYVKGRKSGQGLAAQTVLHVHRTLSQALEHAVRTGVLFKNPAEQVRPPRPPRREIVILTKPEVATLLSAAGPLRLPVLVGVTTGMRRGEILGLRWSDIDLKRATLTVNQSLERLQGTTVLKPPKTAGSRRTITLPALTVDALAAHRAAQARLGPDALVFSHPDGSAWDPDSLTKAFAQLVAAAGVRRITFHGLRHTHISHQLMDGVHVKVVSERAGHANVAITLSVYATFVPTLQADAAAGVDTWLRREIADQVGAKSVPISGFRKGDERLSD
jgi:integrase